MRTAIAFVILLSACNQAGTGSKNDSSATENTTPQGAVASCYNKINGRDTVKLSLVVDEDKVNGTLEYNIYEKDKNTGVITGTMEDNILRATYEFQSEGVKSTRNVVFKIMGDQAYEAQADSLTSDGLPVFNGDATLLKFEPSPFKKIPCE
ncbi:hypothetical protein [Chitinophaga niabensis]|uniref:NlpE N-terminal domain-containing protein n=1 Tax=Chitinophaga niabensis TaxID=536979 RepID=A0A1N6DSJ3_9BACT|nr:hypothetical protein [Chitinophaga niabensis]SIN73667.1 hypothetical protein SAMN04488055_1041 [Chitinophaga niabensis]